MVPDNSSDHVSTVDSDFDFHLVALAVLETANLLLHIKGKLDESFSFGDSADVISEQLIAFGDASSSHVGVANSFDFLDSVLDAEVVVDPEERVEDDDDVLSFLFDDAIEVADVAEEDGDVEFDFLELLVVSSGEVGLDELGD